MIHNLIRVQIFELIWIMCWVLLFVSFKFWFALFILPFNIIPEVPLALFGLQLNTAHFSEFCVIWHKCFNNPYMLQVSAVPTVIAMRGGDVIDQFVGIKDEDQLDSFVEKLIGQWSCQSPPHSWSLPPAIDDTHTAGTSLFHQFFSFYCVVINCVCVCARVVFDFSL